MTQRDLLLAKFHMNGNVLTTAHFAQDPMLACEYRRLLCELRKKPGYSVAKRKITNNLFEYTLVQFFEESNGQMVMI